MLAIPPGTLTFAEQLHQPRTQQAKNEENMKSKLLNCITGMSLLAGVTIPLQVAAQNHNELNKKPAHYSVHNLGALGGTSSSANGISNKGWVSGSANITGDTIQHGFLWTEEDGMKDLGTLGGPNSLVNWPVRDNRGLIVGVSETSMADPLGENFCGFGNHLTCLGFLWQDGAMTPLPTLGGNNSFASGINNRGQAVGIAENTTPDPCLTAPQVLDWKPVIWGPQKGANQGAASASWRLHRSGYRDQRQRSGGRRLGYLPVSVACKRRSRSSVGWRLRDRPRKPWRYDAQCCDCHQ